MPQSPSFSLTGEQFFVNTSVSFLVTTESTSVDAYEWYLDGLLVIDATTAQFSGQVDCGAHIIGVRLLSNGAWTGSQDLSFATCKTVSSSYISGPAIVTVGDSEAYTVIWQFSDGTTVDMTTAYTFSSTSGGTFSGNIFTATGDDSGDDIIPVTLTASSSTYDPLTKQISVVIADITDAGILVVDLFGITTLNAIGLVDNVEVTNNHVPAYTGNNIVPAAAAPAEALILASDIIPQDVLNWRFEFNIAQLLINYPETLFFVFYIDGRAETATTITGAFVLKTFASQMTLTGSPGTYLPSVDGDNLGDPVNFSSDVVAGADGSYEESDLTMIIKLVYDVAGKAITYTTHLNPIVIPDFDFMTVKYSWDGGGTDLDILVGFENNGTDVDNLYVGYGQPNATVPADTTPQSDAYLWWGSDNTTSDGSEDVLIGIKQFIAAYPSSPDAVEVGLYAVWYGAPATGDFTVELVTYKGGTMSLEGTDFVNTGGAQVSSNTIAANTTIRNDTLHTPSNTYKVGTLIYTKSTQTATVQIN